MTSARTSLPLSTITWDPDFGSANITGSTPIDTMNLPGAAQQGFDGIEALMTFPAGCATTAAGNFAAIYTMAAGETLRARYNSAIAKWVKV
jgi:hypothetical protein